VYALVDSTVPYMWLPPAACQAFEAAFGISWDPIQNLYLLNDTAHSNLVKSNAIVIFELSNSPTGGASVNITMPYASFDLQATTPLVKTASRYFPLQRAADDSSYTLGRVFLQEAYIVVESERSKFTISQAVYDASTPSHIVTIAPNNSTSTNPSNPSSTGGLSRTNGGSHGISTGAIVGIAVIIVLVALAGSVGGFFLARRRRRSRGGNKGKKLAELEGDHPETKGSVKMDDTMGRDSYDDSPAKKAPMVAIRDAGSPLTPPHSLEVDGGGYFRAGSPSKPTELPGEVPPRWELSTPEPFSELPSPDLDKLRHEATSPEPSYSNTELPGPDAAYELPSPNLTSRFSEVISPVDPPSRSALTSPVPRLPRPVSLRMDSSESESDFTRDGMRSFHRRFGSNRSDRPRAARRDTGDSSESAVLGIHQHRFTSVSSEVESDVQSMSTVTQQPSLPIMRPRTYRNDSDTWQTRLEEGPSSENSAAASRTNSGKHQKGSSDGDTAAREGLLTEEANHRASSATC